MPRPGTRRTIEHRDFTGGDWGRRQPWNAPKNSFSATNMLLYSTGELGVRPGLQNVTPSNVASGTTVGGICGSRETGIFTYGQGTKMYASNAVRGSTASISTGNFTGNVTNMYFVTPFDPTYVMDSSRGIYSYILNTLTQLTTISGQGFAFYGDRLCVGTNSGIYNLRYNGLTAGVSDLTNWPAANIIPIGDPQSRIQQIFNQRGHLSILKKVNGFYVITGQLGVNETLRRAINALGPGSDLPNASTITSKDMIWSVQNLAGAVPTSFDGTNTKYYDDQIVATGDGQTWLSPFSFGDEFGVAMITGPDPAIPAYNKARMLLFHHGVWTRHEFSVAALSTVVGLSSVLGTALYDPGGDLTSTATFPTNLSRLLHTVPVMVLGDLTSTTPTFYSLALDLDRPGYAYPSTATYQQFDMERPGDVSATQVSGSVDFPEFHFEDTSEGLVREVIVDFRSWNTTGSLTNHFDITVDSLRLYDNDSPRTSITNSWDEAGSLSSTGGTLKRMVFSVGDQGVGNGYQLHMTNIRGIAIQRIQVIVETVGLRGA